MPAETALTVGLAAFVCALAVVTVRLRRGRASLLALVAELEEDAREAERRIERRLALDRSERQKVEHELSEMQAMFERFMENCPVIAFMKDEDGRLLYTNPTFGETFGMRPEDSLGKTDLELWPRETAEQLRRNDVEILSAWRARQCEETVQDPAGTRTWISYKFPFRRASGAKVLAGMAIEITERKQLLAKAEAAVALRDEFMAIAAHELRTPMTPLKLQLATLQKLVETGRLDQHAPEKLRRMFEISNQQIRRLAALVDELLDVSRLSSGHLVLRLEDIDLAQLVSEVMERMYPDLGVEPERVAMHLNGAVKGRWDRLRVEQCVVNLVSNAVKYGLGKPITITVDADGDLAQLTVRDQGAGIAAEDQERIFGRFERAVSSKHFGGFGLGLYITRQIATAHGGSVHVESRLGEGSSFVLALRRAPAVSIAPTATPALSDVSTV